MHTHAVYEKYIQRNVQSIQKDRHNHRVARVLHPQKPAVDSIQTECCRGGKNADLKIDAGIPLNFRRCFDQPETEVGNPDLQQQNQQAEHTGNSQSPCKCHNTGGPILLSKSLGGDAGRAHSQEPKSPKNKIEDHTAHGDGSQIISFLKMTY